MILAFTGHRPEKIGGHVDHHSASEAPGQPLQQWISAKLRDVITNARPLYCISGMALGVDQLAAQVCIDLKVPFIAAVPFVGQERVWRADAQRHYQYLLSKAHEVVIVTEGGYEQWKMAARNHWMVDHCNKLVAVWNGTTGGTAGTVLYAVRVKREIVRINPNDFLVRQGAA
jgi:uncharacterized phage-like protein YoqJ